MPAWTYQFLAKLGEGGLTNGICVILVLMFIYGLWDKRFGRVCPSLMTSLGILGTFCGIYLSLYPLDFSPGNMNDSVTQLLGGMRTAFFTSLAGITASIGFKIVERVMSPQGIDNNIKKQMTPEQQLVIEKLEDIREAISGDGNSIMTQLQYIRNENRDAIQKLDQLTETIKGALIDSLEKLTNEIREVIVEQLNESIQDLISRIEKALIDQIGKAFEEFNEATQSIKEWQEDNREHIKQLTAAFDMSARQIESIARNCETIPATMASLSRIMDDVGREMRQLQSLLESFAELRKQAGEAFPMIKKHLDKIGEDLAKSAEGFIDLDRVLRETFTNAQESIEMIGKKHLENVKEVAKSMTSSMKEESTKSSHEIQKLVKQTVETFGERISSESIRIAREYGENMISIAEQCARAIERSAKGGNNHG